MSPRHEQATANSPCGGKGTSHHKFTGSTPPFFRIRFLFLSCRLLQCVTTSMLLFFPQAYFGPISGEPYSQKISHFSHFTHYGLNQGIVGPSIPQAVSCTQFKDNSLILVLYIQAAASLLHNFVCYMVYFADKACLPFIMLVTESLLHGFYPN